MADIVVNLMFLPTCTNVRCILLYFSYIFPELSGRTILLRGGELWWHTHTISYVYMCVAIRNCRKVAIGLQQTNCISRLQVWLTHGGLSITHGGLSMYPWWTHQGCSYTSYNRWWLCKVCMWSASDSYASVHVIKTSHLMQPLEDLYIRSSPTTRLQSGG